MPGVYEYIIQMQDRTSGTLQKLTGSSFEAVQKFVTLQDKIDTLKRTTGDFGNSIYNLKQKIDILQQERDLIDPSNLTKIRQYNKEISSLSRTINKLENTSGGKFKTYAKDAFAQISGAGLMTNPLVMAGAGVAAVGKLSVSWEEGMAKINATAQLPQKELDKLDKTIKKLGVDAGANLQRVPDAYEKILSQTGDVALSTDILDKALKGAKAGFTDIDVVAGAVAQSLSAIGKENTNAQEVLDTLFAAKRVGAGEFADFARYVPTLVSAGQNVGASWKETAGMFAYMTGKGQEAGNAAMYIQNAFTALGKSEITGGLKKAGVNVFDQEGKMKSVVDIFTDLSKLTKTMSDQQKSDFFEKIGLRDMQAKAAFSILTGETDKLRTSIEATANASGELQKALDNTNNTGNKLREGWAKVQGIGESLGGIVLTLLNPALDILNGILSGVAYVIEGVGSVWNWWTQKLREGNPWIAGLTILVAGLTTALIAHNLWLKKDVAWTAIVTATKKTWAAVTGFVTGTVKALNVALANTPLDWIAAGITAVIAIYAIWQRKVNSVAQAQKTLNGVESEAWKSIAERKVQLDALTKIVSDNTRSLEDRQKALTELQRLYPKEYEFLTTQNALTGKAIELKEKLIDKLLQEAKVRAAQDKLTELAKQELEFQTDPDKSAATLMQKLGNFALSQGSLPVYELYNAQSGVNNLNNGLDEIKKKREALEGFLKNSGALEINIGGDGGNRETTGGDVSDLLAKLGKTKKGKKDSGLSLGLPQDYNQTNTYAAITTKLGVKPPVTDPEQKPDEKPVKSIATRVDEINTSLKKIAASIAVPVVMAAGASQANASQLMPVNNTFTQITETTEKVHAPVTQTEANTYNAFDNRLLREENNLYRNVTNSAESYDNSTSIVDNTGKDASTRYSTVNNTTNDQGRTIHIDRFTDKIEIHVTGQDAPREVADQIRTEVERALAEIFNV